MMQWPIGHWPMVHWPSEGSGRVYAPLLFERRGGAVVPFPCPQNEGTERRAAHSPGELPPVSASSSQGTVVSPGGAPRRRPEVRGCVDPLPAGAASYPANITPHDSALGGPDRSDNNSDRNKVKRRLTPSLRPACAVRATAAWRPPPERSGRSPR